MSYRRSKATTERIRRQIEGLLGADVRQGDTIDDIFHGSGAMLGVWRPAGMTDHRPLAAA